MTIEGDDISLRCDDFSIKQLNEIPRYTTEQVRKGDNLLMSISSVIFFESVNGIPYYFVDIEAFIFELLSGALKQM